MPSGPIGNARSPAPTSPFSPIPHRETGDGRPKQFGKFQTKYCEIQRGGVATPLLHYLALHLAHPTERLVLWHYAYGSLDSKIKGLLMWTRGLTDNPDKLMREIWAKDRLQGPSTDKPGPSRQQISGTAIGRR